MSSRKYTGRGIGTKVIMYLIYFINERYRITEFLIRPWIKNENAIKSYKKCGFTIKNEINILDYYSDGNYNDYGEGDYGVDETLNMHLSLKQLNMSTRD